MRRAPNSCRSSGAQPLAGGGIDVSTEEPTHKEYASTAQEHSRGFRGGGCRLTAGREVVQRQVASWVVRREEGYRTDRSVGGESNEGAASETAIGLRGVNRRSS